MVRPLDLQDNLSKFPLLEKVHEAQRALPQIHHDTFIRSLNEQLAEKMKKTQDSKETEKGVIRDRQQKEQKRGKEKKHSIHGVTAESEDDSQGKGESKDRPPHHIDIVV
ncbi:hypothetical protein DRQ15_00155 [candidate division KSB1 bacterium]|nr:MAG: hypothetical protein B5M50_01775 [candidate division KSB1 bacterium 4484_219]RKY77670.1 MAG: hypothetical protein DRQ00_06555 [candidate division KSB1 bacterium]RKY79435.1 MAG: hypothetical protein DRQ12_03850 [candidate division KSB1 bacterium]RKY93148.1 MAG: hypothetical protein DRQ15_00155 [candidate division KSB1 bacterium]HDI51939.1 hypothetical protein [Bacteroidota bacterium]